MNKTELEIIGVLLGRKFGPVKTNPSAYRGVYDTRQHKVCLKLEEEGLGRIERIDHIAFRFATHDMLWQEGKLG